MQMQYKFYMPSSYDERGAMTENPASMNQKVCL
jgi:hypothetical protein